MTHLSMQKKKCILKRKYYPTHRIYCLTEEKEKRKTYLTTYTLFLEFPNVRDKGQMRPRSIDKIVIKSLNY